MKTFGKIVACVVGIPALLCVGMISWYVMTVYNDMTTTDLNGIIWKVVKYNNSVLKAPNGRVLVGPGVIYLWGKYPYLAGSVLVNGVNGNFIVDVRNYSVAFPSSWYDDIRPKGISILDSVSFGDLNGQWAQKRNSLLYAHC